MAIINKAIYLPRARDLIHSDDPGRIINCIVDRGARILRYKFQKDMRAAGLDMTQEQYFILLKLWQKDGQYQAELTHDALSDAPNITRMLDVMARKGMIERRPDPRDRRKFRIFLDREGRRIRGLYRRQVYASRRSDYRGLEDRDLRELKRILQVIETNIMSQE
jgi:DNA-binding MarR family transcriptional regulator